MTKMCSRVSNYKEINIMARIKAANREIPVWDKEAARFKRYREIWRRAEERDFLPANPLHVDIELSNVCNLRCKMCIHGSGAAKNTGFMKKNLAIKLICECAAIGVYSVKFNWRGEATLNDFLPEAIRAAKESGILEVQINTNGLPKKKDILIECAENGIDRIIFSVDGFSKKTYESQRIGGNYGQVLKNIHSLIEWKRSNKRRRPLIRVQMARTKINFKEVNGFIKYWSTLVDDVRVSDATDRGRGSVMMVGDQITTGRRSCPQPFQRLVVAKDGRVSPCCVDWYQKFVAGDANKESLSSIWNNEKMRYIRDIQRANEHDKIHICKNCFVKESYTWRKNG